MIYILLNCIVYTALVAVMSFWALKNEKNRKTIGILLLTVFGYQLLTYFPFFFPDNPFYKGYNWTGKSLATLFCIFLILIYKKDFYFGFTLKQGSGSLKPVIIVTSIVLIIEAIVLWLYSTPSKASLETYLFQLTIPGISEEIAFRGLFLGLLNAIFLKRKLILKAQMGWGAVVVSVLFIAVHILGFNKDLTLYFHFNFWTVLSLLPTTFLFVWQRERTNSMLIPIVYHNLSNTLMFFIYALK